MADAGAPSFYGEVVVGIFFWFDDGGRRDEREQGIHADDSPNRLARWGAL